MSDNLKDKQKTEEVDLILLSNLLGNFFLKIYEVIKSILRSILSIFVFGLKAVIDNIKLISAVVVISGVIGYLMERNTPEVYSSHMYVKPYFDSKYQLVNNINYFNALISNADYETFTEIFNVTEEDAKTVKGFEIKIGPESENDKIIQYDTYLKSLDSVRAQDITYEDFLENRDIFSSDIFEISVQSSKKDIFKNLENGLNTSFENTYSEKKMKKRDSLIYIQKEELKTSIRAIDSLQKVYIKVLQDESTSKGKSLSLGEGFTIEPEVTRTKEYELLNKEIQLRKELRILEGQKVEEDVFFDVVSGFQRIGSKSKSLFSRYSIIFPVVSFLILCFLYVTSLVVRFVKNYEQ